MIAFFLAALLFAGPGYRAEVEQWRAERENRLKAEDGWLSLTGLFWLQPGENRTGSAPGNRIQLPPGLPDVAGSFVLNGRSVKWRPAGKEGMATELKTDKSGKADIVQVDRIKLHVIERGSEFGVRMRDNESDSRRNFKGLRWFPVRTQWLIKAQFVPYPKPRKMLFDALAGGKQEMTSPGYVEWTHDGKSLRLTPVTEGEELFFIFRDRTAGKTTYPAARFIYTQPAKDGFVMLDFNKAYNPPCVFTPYATCPLPPLENRLALPVEAGEMMYEGHTGAPSR